MNTPRIYIRALEPSDLEFLYKHENMLETMQWGGERNLYSKYDLKRFIEDSHKDITVTTQKRFVIALSCSDMSIGTIDLFEYDAVNRRVSVGLIFYDNEYRNLGYGSDAIGLVKQFCIQQLSVHQLYVEVEQDNLNSIKLFENAGFEYCGTKRDWVQRSGKFYDVRCYQCIV